MGGQITISIRLFWLLLAVSVWAVLDRMLIPSSRWFLRWRINRGIDEVSMRLDIRLLPAEPIPAVKGTEMGKDVDSLTDRLNWLAHGL